MNIRKAQDWAGLAASVAVFVMAVTFTVLAIHAGAAPWDNKPRLDVVTVPCPSEDSCTVDYYDGAWYIGPPGSRS